MFIDSTTANLAPPDAMSPSVTRDSFTAVLQLRFLFEPSHQKANNLRVYAKPKAQTSYAVIEMHMDTTISPLLKSEMSSF